MLLKYVKKYSDDFKMELKKDENWDKRENNENIIIILCAKQCSV